MKVSIITLHRVFNYGSVLQAYATQKVFENAGCDVNIIDYITEQRTNKRLFFNIPPFIKDDIIHRTVYLCGKDLSVLLKKITFGSFLRKNVHLTKKYITQDDLIKDPPKADVYVTGSDQTWNSQYNEGIDKGFFLEFAPEDKKKISFAASFGKSELDSAEVQLTKQYLSKYHAISVREDTAQSIVESMGLSAMCMIDPTLQLNKEEWVQIASKRLVKEKYLILMLLYNEDNGATELARRIADKKGLKLVKISWELKKPALVDQLMTHRSPQDFLSLFYHAEFVVTNSFHGTAFSINLEKQFLVVPRNEFNSRIESILRFTGLDDRLVSEENDPMKKTEEPIDYVPVNEVLQQERKRAMEFIKNNI